jgi:DNA-binding CsgD family transcriptional regulator
MSPRENALRQDRELHERFSAPGAWSSSALWRGIVSGRWSIAETFVENGRRYLLVRRNPAGQQMRRALTAREREVAERVCLGLSNKEIGWELGIAVPTVSGRLARALRRLGLRSRVELARLMPPGAVTRESK